MKYLYAVRDVKANDVGDQVMVCKADAVAVRAFTDALSNPQSFMAKYPEDYELLELGSLTEEGIVESIEPRVVLTGAAWKAARDAASANAGV